MTDAQKYALALRQQQEARQPVIAKLRGVALGAIKSGKPMPLVRRAVAHAASQLRPLPPESVLVEALAEAVALVRSSNSPVASRLQRMVRASAIIIPFPPNKLSTDTPQIAANDAQPMER